MELVLRDGKNELCIDHQEGSIGFVVMTEDNKQLNFDVDIDEWKQLKTFIDDSIYEFENNKKKSNDFKEVEIQNLQTEVHKIVGDGEVMKLFNKLLGVNAG